MLDLQEGILLEFVERAATTVATLPFGFRLVVVGTDVKLPTGAECRAQGACPDCGKAPQAKRIRCESCAKKHAAKCKIYRNEKKAA